MPIKKSILHIILLIVGGVVFGQEPAIRSAEWQWSVALKGGREHAGPARAFLWIPPDCKYVRAVVIAQNNMEEESILESLRFRKAMAEMGLAEIWVSPPFDHLFRFNEGAGDTFTAMMDTLADLSGYKEVRSAPIVPMGHSAAASWPYYFAAWNPGRTLATISVSGQWPYFRSPIFAPDIWGDRNIDGIPCLETMGEYEAADTWANEGLKERQQHPAMPLSMLANPAQGHFAATDVKIDYLALYIRKAMQYRLSGKALRLRPIDPIHTGWLVDRWHPNAPPSAPAAPVGKYTGDPSQAFWFFDEEMARATEKYEVAWRGKKAALLGYIQNGKIVSQRNTHQQVDLGFQPGPDGLGFRLQGTFLDTVPGESSRPAAWTGLPAGSSVEHPADDGAIAIHRITGPFRETGLNTFEVSLEKGLGDSLTRYELWFAAVYPGDSIFRPAVQQSEMVIPVKHTQGIPQHIDFPALPDKRVGGLPVRLYALSDAGLPVRFYVLEGPVILEGDSVLSFTKTPPRSRYPVKVTVVAWQWGRLAEPAVQTAAPVSRSFLIYKKEK